MRLIRLPAHWQLGVWSLMRYDRIEIMKRLAILLLFILVLALPHSISAQFGGCLPGFCAATTVCTPVVVTNTKTIDGTAGNQFSATNTGTITLTTTLTNNVIILVYYHESNTHGAQTISSVTSTHLTWTRRSFFNPTVGSNPWDFEIWWAPATAALTAEVITIALT